MCVQHELREEVIEKVKWNVNRDSPEDKLRDFLEWMKAVKRDTLHQVHTLTYYTLSLIIRPLTETTARIHSNKGTHFFPVSVYVSLCYIT